VRLLDGWDSRLHAAIEAARGKTFQWGVFDCCLFACDVVLAETGVDMAEGLRGTYDDLQGAGAAMKRIGGGGIEQLVEHFAAKHRCREVRPAFAQRGGVTLIDTPDRGPALGICLGHLSIHLAPAPDGLIYVPMKTVRRAWVAS
jgi:hypothetical protein